MKPIRMFILFAIGMIAFTGTANTTANLEQKQKVGLVTEFISPMVQSQVVEVNKEITVSQNQIAVEVQTQSLKKIEIAKTFYTSSEDVGWCRSQTILYNIQKEVVRNMHKSNLISNDNILNDIGKDSSAITNYTTSKEKAAGFVGYRVYYKPIYNQSNCC